MRRLEVLLEGESDAPTVREILTRRFGLREELDFRLYPHQGRGRLPRDILSPPEPRHRGLLDQLPAKLRGMSYLGEQTCVVVLLDADSDPCHELLAQLEGMLQRLHRRPKRVLFRIAIEETESWFIADPDAIKAAYKGAAVHRLRRIAPDAVVGAWEALAAALDTQPSQGTGAVKQTWARRIAPHLDLEQPKSPSLRKFIDGISRELDRSAA